MWLCMVHELLISIAASTDSVDFLENYCGSRDEVDMDWATPHTYPLLGLPLTVQLRLGWSISKVLHLL